MVMAKEIKKRKRKGTLAEQKERDRIAARRSAYRRMWLKDPKRADILEAVKRKYKGPNKKQKWEYKCAKCEEYFIRTKVQVDHIIPCGSYLKDEDEDGYRQRLLDSRNLQVLCKSKCHKQKTADERKKRAKK